MTRCPVTRHRRARLDLEQAALWYATEAGSDVALAFVDAVEAVLERLSTHPQSGSSRYARVLGYPGLRCALVKRFPYLVFYLYPDERVDVLRILHAHADIPTWLELED